MSKGLLVSIKHAVKSSILLTHQPLVGKNNKLLSSRLVTVEYQKNEKYRTALRRYGCQYGESKLRYWQMRLQIQLIKIGHLRKRSF